MDIGQLREGNIIIVYPRENQEGILSVRELQRGSIICDMLSPRAGYQFRIRFNEINPIRLSNDWLVRASFIRNPKESNSWIGPDEQLPLYFSGQTGILGKAESREIIYLHQLQNTYRELTGKELQITLN